MTNSRPRVLIVGDRRRAGVSEGVARHLPFLTEHVQVDGVDLDEEIDLGRAQGDLVLVFGGDGSILHVARRLGANAIPVLGVNYGRFGFLADLSPNDLEEGIRRWRAGDVTISERMRLRVRLFREDGAVREWLALNDVVAGSSQLGRMADVNVDIDGHRAVSYSGDGLILATTTGSTAHALAAGGPLLDPTLDAMVMVPIAPHSLATRPLVLAGSHCIRLSVRGSRAPCHVTVDGGPTSPLADGDRLEVLDGETPLHLVRVFGGPFYEALRRKLGWRGRPVYSGDREAGAASALEAPRDKRAT